MEPEPSEVALEVAGVLDRLGIPYLVGGSVASSIHGEYRTSADIDFVVHLGPGRIGELCAALEPRYFVDEDLVRDAVRLNRSFNVIHRRYFLKVDLFVRENEGLSRSEMARAQSIQFGEAGGPSMRVASPEDTVLQKLCWYRLGNEVSDRQWRDVVGVLKARGPSLDRGYLHRWARQLRVDDLLDRALGEAGAQA